MGYEMVRRAIDMGMANCHYWKRYDADVPDLSTFPGWQTD